MKASLVNRLDRLQERYEEITALLGDAQVISDQTKYRAYSKEYAEVEPVVKVFQTWRKTRSDLEEAQGLLKDADLDVREMAVEEVSECRASLETIEADLQRLMLPIWRKYRYGARFQRGATDPFSSQLFALIGLGGEQIRQAQGLNWRRLLPYLGLLSLRAHSAALIESVLRYYFKHAALTIEQCIERRVVIAPEQRNALGLGNHQLGDSLVLGERVRDRSGKFRIHIRDLDWQRFHEFLPIGEGYQPLCALVRFTLRDPLDYDIRLQLRHEEVRELRIGAHNTCRLGWTSWLGRERADGVVTLNSTLH